MKVRDILEKKGRLVVTIPQTCTVFEAISTFAAHRVGSLLVLDENEIIVGIIGARDVLMAVNRSYGNVKTLPVKDIMTRDVIIGNSEDDLEKVRALMTENRIRHLPIIDEETLSGIISIGDVVKAELTEIHVENRYLRDFIEGKYPA
ncbi:MAG: CBS domain-containing protein [Candidatus Zhuqueibacterota bacterium]